MQKHTRLAQSDFDDDIDERDLPRVPWVAFVGLLVVLFLYLPVTAALGLSSFGPGVRLYGHQGVIHALLMFVAYTAAISCVLVIPYTLLVLPHHGERWGTAGRVLAVLLLFSPPLVSFACFQGQVASLMDLYEALLAVLPAVLLAALIHERSGSGGAFTLFLSLATFIPLFVVNDLLTSFPVWFNYASRSPAFYWWRSLFPALAIIGGTLALGRLTVRLAPAPWLRQALIVVLALFGYALLVRLLLPVVVATKDHLAPLTYVRVEYTWIFYPIVALLLWRRPRWGYTAVVGCCVLAALTAAVEIAAGVWRNDATFWGLSGFSYGLCAVALFLWLFARLREPSLKGAFTRHAL